MIWILATLNLPKVLPFKTNGYIYISISQERMLFGEPGDYLKMVMRLRRDQQKKMSKNQLKFMK